MKDISECTEVTITGSWKLVLVSTSKENNVFSVILLGTTIRNDSKKERSNGCSLCFLCWSYKYVPNYD